MCGPARWPVPGAALSIRPHHRPPGHWVSIREPGGFPQGSRAAGQGAAGGSRCALQGHTSLPRTPGHTAWGHASPATHSSVIGEQLKCLSETDGGTSRRHLQSEAQTQHEPATGTPCRLTGGLTPAPQERARTACRSPYPWSKPQQDRSPSPNLTQANQRTHSRDGLSCSPKIHTCGHPNPQNLYKRGCIWRQGL